MATGAPRATLDEAGAQARVLVLAGRYRLCERLGAGAHGEVFVAEDLILGERVAIKLLRRTAGEAPVRVRREVSALRLLRLPGVVQLLDEGIAEDRPFLVMELVQGAPFPGKLERELERERARALGGDEAGAATGEEPPSGPSGFGRASARGVAAPERTAAATATGSSSPSSSRTRRIRTRRAPAGAASRPPRPPSRRIPWAALEERATALLETLARVHAAGVVHRDLKPANVLVTPEGRPIVLDFGLSAGQPLGEGLTEVGRVLGTPAYLAPEQALGQPVDARADLYAVGVMLYHALTGRMPHPADDVEAVLLARLMQAPTPVLDVVPDVPAAVAAVVDRMLARSPDDRPRSAAEVLAALREQGQPRALRAEIPRLGGDAPVRAVIAAARAGRPIDVVGPPGTGRTRCLAEAAEALAAEGREVVWTRASRRPFGSLLPLLTVAGGRGMEGRAAEGIAAASRWISRQVRAALARGVVLVADDADALDRWSAQVLARCRAAGAVVCARSVVPAARGGRRRAGDRVELAPLDEAALRQLFAGPDRLFHLREDAARALWERTEGLPARIAAEVQQWARAGLSRWDGPLLAVDRDALERLDAGLSAAMLAPGAPPSRHADAPHLDDLLQWLSVAGPRLPLGALAAAMGEPAWRLEAEIEELIQQGLARRVALTGARRRGALQEAAPVGAAPRVPVTGAWSPAELREAHLAVAALLRPGDEDRLLHLLAGAGALEIAREAFSLGRARAQAGRLGAAVAALAEGLHALRGSGASSAEPHVDHGAPKGHAQVEAKLLAQWVKIAFAERTNRALDRVLYEICRVRAARGEAAGARPALEHLEALVRAALAAGPEMSSDRALAALEAVPPFADPELERWRQFLRLRTAGRVTPPRTEEVLADVTAWAARERHPVARSSLAGWRGLLCYEQGRFEEAARLHAEAAAGERWVAARVASLLNRASALLEAFQHREAAAQAESARALAVACRHPYYEGRAAWLLRSAVYRSGAACEPDVELVEAVARLGAQDLEGLVRLNEAAVALRAGARDLAASLAAGAAVTWGRLGRRWTEMVARALAIAAGAPATRAEIDALAERAARCPVMGFGVQALGLLGRACPAARAGWQAALGPLAEQVPRAHWGRRMDVLSVLEALEDARLVASAS